ncbi:uncharacterized protein TNCT_699841 [Trichonephila clavata]|uniref:Peptidase aspartic putative domain-containing protein n=1 Tax=Trichonephila clavata TaxID=2740835 RepID=A0A8X6KAX2_TRICU|nr:uncharacterized protein TNCT_699841 [Trichonephila clavata]
MTSSETGITLLNRKRGNIKCQLTKMANALQKQTDLSIPELQAKLDILLKLQDKFELLKNDYYRIANDTEYAEAEPSLNSLEDDLQDFEQKHHTLLHKYSTPSTNYKTDLETLGPDLNSSQIVGNSEPDSSSENTRVSFHTNGNNSILINTAIVYVRDSEGIRQPLRAILDCASESSFISSKSAEALGLQKEKVNIPISGLNDASIYIRKKIYAQISNARNDSQWEIDLLLVPKISHFSPSKRINITHLNIPSNIHLADPKFSIPQRVDLLLGQNCSLRFWKWIK